MSSTIDWSKAPEWANAVVVSLDGALFWVEQFGGISKRQRFGHESPDISVAKMTGGHGWNLVAERPTEPAPWNGECLPPVGTVCEMYWGSGRWRRAEVFAHKPNANGGVDALVEVDGDWSYSTNPSSFRPLKTAEQIAAEERSAAVDEMMKTFYQGNTVVGGADGFIALYNAGYRKVEQP